MDAYLRPYASLFQRDQSRETLNRYITGLLSDIPRKNCVAIAEAVGNTTNQRLQRLLTAADWDVAALDERRVRLFAREVGEAGALVLGELALPSRSDQWFAGQHVVDGTYRLVEEPRILASILVVDDGRTRRGWPVSIDFWIPRHWFDDRETANRARLPRGTAYRTKAEIALGLVDRARRCEVPFDRVIGPGFDDLALLDQLDARHLPYVFEVNPAFPIQVRTTLQVLTINDTMAAPHEDLIWLVPFNTVQSVTRQLPVDAWQAVPSSADRPGDPRQVAAMRVHRATERTSGVYAASAVAEGWLLAERPGAGERSTSRWYFSNVAADASMEALLGLTHHGSYVNDVFETARACCGLDDYEGRLWQGCVRHMHLVLLAQGYLNPIRSINTVS